MKEFSNLIKIEPLSSQHTDEILLVADRVDLSPISEDSEDGVLLNCSTTIVCDLPEDTSVLDFLRLPRECIITIRDSKRQEHRIGSSGIPARAMLIPYFNKANLQISCKQLISPLL